MAGGIKDIKEHPFFASVDWNKHLNKEIRVPFKPQIESELDVSNIDRVFTRENPRETPEDSMLLQKKKFEDFTYVKNGRLNDDETETNEFDYE